MSLPSSLTENLTSLAIDVNPATPASPSTHSAPSTSTAVISAMASPSSRTSAPVPTNSHDSHDVLLEPHDPLTVLGADVFHVILMHLSVTELVAAEAVCRSWRAFSYADSALWTSIGRRLGVDLPEWERTVRERDERAREAEERRPAERTGGPVEVGAEQDTDPQAHAAEATMPAGAAVYRSATIAHLELQKAWKQRHIYETVIPTPAFKLRHVAVDSTEDLLYALTESAPRNTDKLLVLDRYTGQLLLTVPWITRNATMSVGAGYVVVASAPGATPEQEEEWRVVEPEKIGQLHIYRTAKAVQRSSHLANRFGLPPPPDFKTDRGLPLEFFCTTAALADCRAFRVKLDTRTRTPQAVLAGVQEGRIVLVYLEDGVREEVIETVKVQTIDGCDCNQLGDSPLPENVYLLDIDFDDEFIYIVTQYQCHVFERESNSKVVAFPDPRHMQAALAYRVRFNFPFHVKHERRDPRPTTLPPRAPEGIGLALTVQARVSAWRCDTQTEAFAEAMADSRTAHHWWAEADSMSTLRSVTVNNRDLVLRHIHGKAIIIRNHREVFNSALEEEPEERNRFVGQNTAVLCLREPIEDLHFHGSRLFLHSAEMTILCFDMDQLPALPFSDDEPVPDAKMFVFEISSLDGMQSRSSFAVDARGVYLADWDKGYPDPELEIELLHHQHVTSGTWPHAIRPKWGCIKIWTARPESTLLTYEYPHRLARAIDDGVIDVFADDASGSTSSGRSGSDTESALFTWVSDEEEEPFNDDDMADALAVLFGVGDSDENDDGLGDGLGALFGDEAGSEDDLDDSNEDEDGWSTDDTGNEADTASDDSDDSDDYADDDFYQSLFNPNYPNPA